MIYLDQLKNLDADPAFVGWCRGQNHPTIEAAWAACPRGDWLVLLAEHLTGNTFLERVPTISAVLDCAALAQTFVPYETSEAKVVLEVTRAYLCGEAAVGDVFAAAEKAYRVWTQDTSGYSPVYAAKAAALAGFHASDEGRNKRALAYFAQAATYNTAFSASLSVTSGRAKRFAEVHALCADIVRRHISAPPKLMDGPIVLRIRPFTSTEDEECAHLRAEVEKLRIERDKLLAERDTWPL